MRGKLHALALLAAIAYVLGDPAIEDLRDWMARRRLHTRKMDERVARLEAELALLATVRAVSDTELPARITETGNTFARIMRDVAGGPDVR